MKMGWCFMSSVAVLLFCTGCASTVTVEAKGIQKADALIPPHVTYAIFPTTEVEKDPAFSTYARLVAKKMDERGFKESESRTAQLGVYLGYGVTESSSSTPISGAPPPMGNPGGVGTGSGGYGGGGGYGSAVSSTDPTSVRRFTSQVVIVVGDLPKSRAAGSLAELWRGEALSTGDNNLPAMAPLLVEAGFRHFGETTSPPVQHTFSEEEIKKLRDAK